MKTTKTNLSNQRTSSDIDLFSDNDVPRAARAAVRDAVGEYLVEQIQLAVAAAESPVEGHGKFERLSPEYAELKRKEVGHANQNLEASGHMLDQLGFRATSEGVEVGIFGDAAPQADGHNNFSGRSKIPTRRFLPAEGEAFVSTIQNGVEQIIADVIADNQELTKEDFEEVETKSELYDVLAKTFTTLSRSEIRAAVLRSDTLVTLLNELDLLELL